LFRIIFYILIGFFIWRVIKSIFVNNKPDDTLHYNNADKIDDQSLNIDKNSIEDANFEDVDS